MLPLPSNAFQPARPADGAAERPGTGAREGRPDRFASAADDLFQLPAGFVNVYEARADRPPIAHADLEALLSEDERDRLERFRFERERRRSVAAWGMLRVTLGAVVGQPPAALRFRRDRFGKPALADGPSFNLSHSGEHIMIAVAAEGRVGVDVELVRPLPDVDALAEMTFSADEVEALRTLRPADRERAFFRVWTRKEAFVKAIGGGLSLALPSFTVSAGAGPVRLRVDDASEDPARWSLCWIPRGPDAEAALAWDRPDAQLRRFELGPTGA